MSDKKNLNGKTKRIMENGRIEESEERIKENGKIEEIERIEEIQSKIGMINLSENRKSLKRILGLDEAKLSERILRKKSQLIKLKKLLHQALVQVAAPLSFSQTQNQQRQQWPKLLSKTKPT